MAEEVVPLFDTDTIAARVHVLAEEISRAAPADLLVVGLLRGAFIFVADLLRALTVHGASPTVEFLTVSSYGNEKKSSGEVHLSSPVPERLDGRTVLLVDDVADTGRTLAFVVALLREGGAARVLSCALIDKPSKREVAFEPDFVGFSIGDEFVVGYGIDFAGRYRQLPFIGVIR